ncbi:MAG TPA: hypothetical protein VGH33_26280, partial [Isosphaeraceae bacterium]
MANWDVFHSTRLEVERGLDDAAVRAALAQGDLTDDDLIRPAGSGSPWERLGDRLDVLTIEPPASPPPQGSTMDVVPPPPKPAEPPARPDATEWSTEILDRAGSKEHETAEDDDVDVAALESGPDFEQVDPETSTPALFAFIDDEADDAEGLEILDDEEPTQT